MDKRWPEPLRKKFLNFTRAVGKLPMSVDAKMTVWLFAGVEIMRTKGLRSDDMPSMREADKRR